MDNPENQRPTVPDLDIIIRDAKDDDFGEIVALYGDLHPNDPALPRNDAMLTNWRVLLARPGLHIIVAEIAGVLVSSCTLCVIPNLTHAGKPYALVENVVTRRDHRRRGFGTAVLEHALTLAWNQGCYKVMLMTGSKRESTLAFYEKAGFARGVKIAFVARPPMESE